MSAGGFITSVCSVKAELQQQRKKGEKSWILSPAKVSFTQSTSLSWTERRRDGKGLNVRREEEEEEGVRLKSQRAKRRSSALTLQTVVL